MFHVMGSQSTSTGFTPARTKHAAQEMMVKLGNITSSSAVNSKATTAASSATEPLATAIPYLRPTREANWVSNFSTKGPSEEIQPESMHSFKYFFSFPLSRGSFTAIKLLPINFYLF